ncbi:MAG: hypothetical protein NVSMB32_00850 [Actinomycetota bacterium]
MKGQFISAVAQDPTATTAGVPGNGKPDPACQAAIDKAKVAAVSPGQSGSPHGKPDVTATATTGVGNNPNGYGPENHPGATSNPAGPSHPGTGRNPTGFGPTSHPGRP